MSALAMLYDRYRWIIVLTLLAWGVAYFSRHLLEDWDSVDFALALKSYNIKTYQPHFPRLSGLHLFAAGYAIVCCTIRSPLSSFPAPSSAP